MSAPCALHQFRDAQSQPGRSQMTMEAMQLERFAELLSTNLSVSSICKQMAIDPARGHQLLRQIESDLGWQAQ